MNGWFTVENIDDTTWAISEYGHWEEPHSYLLVGNAKAVLIDTGLGIQSIKQIVKNFTSLPVQVILTHAHWDHMGGIKEFEDVAVHEADSNWLEHGLPITDQIIQQNFAKVPTTKPLPSDFNLTSYTTPRRKPKTIFKGNELINLGNRTAQILHTPGHSPGSICVYEESKGYLFTGDTLYKGTLYMNYESTDPVAFARSIQELVKLDGVKKILPGHHELNVPTSLLTETYDAFQQLKHSNQLRHGSGLHRFENIALLV